MHFIGFEKHFLNFLATVDSNWGPCRGPKMYETNNCFEFTYET